MKAAGKILRFYRNLIVMCIPLFMATGILLIFKNADVQEWSLVLSGLVVPVLLGYLSGKECGGDAGGFAGALAVSAVVWSASGTSMTVAILAGSGAGLLYRVGIKRWKDRIPPGFEMLVGNLYLAAVGLLAGTVSCFVFLPVVSQVERWAGNLIIRMMETGMLPFSSLFIEPLKILFFNNWLNHGFLLPLGLEQVKAFDRSVLFLLETNPGPGFGILAAFLLVYHEKRKELVSGILIQMLGGIHEIYFPYVLSNLRLLWPAILGGIVGNYCFMIFGCKLSGPAAPGSLITILMMADLGQWPALLLGMGASAAVSGSMAFFILKRGETERAQKAQKVPEIHCDLQKGEPVKIYFVCDGGMGSSAMACGLLKRKLKSQNLEQAIEVSYVSVDHIPNDASVLVCQKNFAPYLPKTAATCFQVNSLVDLSEYEELLHWLKGDD